MTNLHSVGGYTCNHVIRPEQQESETIYKKPNYDGPPVYVQTFTDGSTRVGCDKLGDDDTCKITKQKCHLVLGSIHEDDNK